VVDSRETFRTDKMFSGVGNEARTDLPQLRSDTIVNKSFRRSCCTCDLPHARGHCSDATPLRKLRRPPRWQRQDLREDTQARRTVGIRWKLFCRPFFLATWEIKVAQPREQTYQGTLEGCNREFRRWFKGGLRYPSCACSLDEGWRWPSGSSIAATLTRSEREIVLSRVSTSPRNIEIQFEISRSIEIRRQHDLRRLIKLRKWHVNVYVRDWLAA
jgi:hypothetical protein